MAGPTAVNPKLWLKADAGLYTTDVGVTPATADADPVGRWEDQSGNVNHASQSVSGNRFLLKTNIVNSLPVVRCVGSPHFLLMTAALPNSPFTLFAVVRPTAFAAYQALIGPDGDGPEWQIKQTSGVMSLVKNQIAEVGASSTQLSTANFNIIAVTYTGSSFVFYLTGGSDGSGTNSQSFTFVGSYLGATKVSGSPGEHFTGDIGEVLVYDSVLSTGERGDVYTYLSGRWIGNPLASGTCSAVVVSGTAIDVAVTTATGGTAPYSYQFQRAPDVTGSPGTYANNGSASSSLTRSDTGLTAGNFYWYRCVVTDNVSGTATSNAVRIQSRVAATYYLSSAGSDSNNGTTTGTPWLTIGKVNTFGLVPGDTVNFNGGDTFNDATLLVATVAGTKALPVVIQSYGSGNATISTAGTVRAVRVTNSSYVTLQNLTITGPGVVSTGTMTGGNTSRMPLIDIENTQSSSTAMSHIRLLNLEVTGGYAGIWVHSTASSSPGPINNLEIGFCEIHDILWIGVWFSGSEATSGQVTGSPFYVSKTAIHQCPHVHDTYVYNVFGGVGTSYSTGFAGQTLTAGALASGAPDDADDDRNMNGTGILVGNVKGGVFEFLEIHHCGRNALATSGGGPGNLWSYESDRLLYQFIESHHGEGTLDGVGIDFDGGTQNSIAQYCYTHHNAGAGILTGNFTGTSVDIANNVYRYCVSEDDGITDTRQAGFWAFTTTASTTVHNCTFYSHTTGTAGAFKVTGGSANYAFNNVFVTRGQNILTHSGSTGWTFSNNLYFKTSGSFVISWNSVSYSTMAAWQAATSQDAAGVSADPLLSAVNTGGTISDLRGFNALLTAYKIPSNSPCVDAGANLPALATGTLMPGPRDFYGNPSQSSNGFDIGAHEYTDVALPSSGGGLLTGGGGMAGGFQRS